MTATPPPMAAILARAKVENVAEVLAAADAVAAKLTTTLVLLDPAAVFNERHLQSAVLHAQRAFEQGRASAKTLGAEILLYAAGERQVRLAIERAGVRAGLERVVVVAVGPRSGAAVWGLLDRLGWSKDPAGLRDNAAALPHHGLGAVGDPEAAILERVALVDIRK